ncbi:MAG: alpha-glucan family phosphorylase [Bacteroidales bacterium]|nr:alpha-glucan family phosphorylase [Bacteroidales bacterium]
MQNNRIEVNAPNWKSVMVTRHLPKELSGLETLCKNLWWCWNDSAKALFKEVDAKLWHNCGHNPMVILDNVSLKRYDELAKDEDFLSQLHAVMDEFDAYMSQKAKRKEPSIGYFCMEYGLDTSLKIYSGGLGILAGDYLKESSDMNVNMVAVGLLYRYGYFTQRLTPQGNQVAEYNAQDFLKIPAEPVLDGQGVWQTVEVQMPGRTMKARIWKVAVGRTDLYLLDTDYEANIPEDRQVTHHLYGGDWENRLKQEILLGIGGVRALRTLGLQPSIYHYNEGHAAFAGLERLREYIQGEQLGYDEALELVRASGLFTTHTPVPAGHDAFDEALLGRYLGHYPGFFGIDWDSFISLGRFHPGNRDEKFSMSVLAANLSQNVNGVSMLHGKVSQDIFAAMYPGYLPEELHISYVTNGVHYATWASKEWKIMHSRVFGPKFKTHHYDKSCFDGIYKVSDEEVWNTRQIVKKELYKALRERLGDPKLSSHYSPSQIVKIFERFDQRALTIGFARRFATYKRATLLFSDLDRLDKIVNNPEHPVQFIFAGKAHPADGMGQDLIKQIVEISKQERFLGRIIFVPGYDITLAKRLVQGVDVWLNNPTRPLEASGTSGEKAAMNGVMHFSVLDGWWVEGYQEGAGWALPQESTYDDGHYQNELDAATIYAMIENDIAPAYYNTDAATGRSSEWIGYIKNTIAKVASNFTTNRMLTDYCERFYDPQLARYQTLSKNGCAKAHEIAAWKRQLRQEWDNIRVVSCSQPDPSYILSKEDMMHGEVVLDLGRLKPEDIGVEMLLTSCDSKDRLHIREVFQYDLTDYTGGIATYKTKVLPERTGMYQVAIRMYARNPELPHRQDFPLVKWL